jgi:hypothetical protein
VVKKKITPPTKPTGSMGGGKPRPRFIAIPAVQKEFGNKPNLSAKAHLFENKHPLILAITYIIIHPQKRGLT